MCFFLNVCAGFPILKLREFSYALFMYIDMTVMFLNFGFYNCWKFKNLALQVFVLSRQQHCWFNSEAP